MAANDSTSADRSTAGKKAAATRARKTTQTQAKKTQTQAQKTAEAAEDQARLDLNYVQDLVERAALTYVGAVLTARDRLEQGYEYLSSTYGDTDSVQKQLKKFERRGSTGRNRFERQLKKSRTRVERELRQRRNQVQREAKSARRDVEKQVKAVRKDVEKQVKPITDQFETVTSQVEKVVNRTPSSVA
jgi:F0F1-type ATP synthase membrane subunit b/b'